MRVLPVLGLGAVILYAAACAGAIVIALVDWRRARRSIAAAERPQPLPRAEVHRG